MPTANRPSAAGPRGEWNGSSLADVLGGLEPMLATSADGPPVESGPAYEAKWDGMRVLIGIEGARHALRTRNRLDAADLLRVHVVDHLPLELAVERSCAHTGTAGIVDTSPLRASVKLCLYSPRLMSCVTLFT